jgi:quercetin dioxygenase-like cupin family protein
MIPMTNIPATRPRTFDVLNTLVRFRAFPDETGGAFSLIDIIVPPGAGAPPHSHPGEQEVFYVLDGQVRFVMGSIGPREIIAGPGDMVTIPDGAIHRFTALGNTPAKMLVIATPGHIHADFFTAVGEVLSEDATVPGAPKAPNFELVAREAARTGITLVR